MKNKNRIRLSSGSDKLEARELLSGASVSSCYCSMPEMQVAVSESYDTGGATTSVSSAVDNSATSDQEDVSGDAANTYSTASGSTDAMTTDSGVDSQGTSQQFGTATNGVTINNANRIGGFGRMNRFGGGFARGNSNPAGNCPVATSGTTVATSGNTETVDNTEVSTESSVVDTSSTNTATQQQGITNTSGITINNINVINGLGAFGGFGGQFAGNFEGEFSGSSQQSSEFNTNIGSTREFNGNSYTMIKNKGNKYTYKNTSLRGGQRTVDFNPTTGTFKTHSPVALDLNGSGAIETTGVSTAKQRVAGTTVGQSVAFDINGDGVREKIEWLSGNGDGLLVDDRDGRASKSMNGNRLFGDADGKYSSGYEKLAQLDVDGNGALSGAELQGLKVWQDNGDAKVQAGEMKSLADVGVDQISVQRQDVANSRGETLMQSVANRNGQSILTEDVWFGQA